MSTTSPLPPAPNAQRLAPPLPRLLWLHTHLLKWIWLGLYLVGLALMLYLTMMGRQYHIELTNMLPQSILGLTGCYLIVAICLLYAGEKEEHLHEFPLHRGWNPIIIHASKITLALVSYFSLVVAIYASRSLLAYLAGIRLDTSLTAEDLAYDLYTPLLLLAWSLLASHFSNVLLNAIGLTFLGLLLQLPISFYFEVFNLRAMLITNTLLIAIILLAKYFWHSRLFSPQLSTFSSRLSSPALPNTEHLPREQSQRLHLNWLHNRQRRLTWLAGIAVVAFSGAFFPLIVPAGPSNPIPVLAFFFIPAFCCAVPLLTFQPEHAQSSYRFWNDRGLPWQSILRSRILGFLTSHLTIIALSILALFLGFLAILGQGPNPNFTRKEAYAELLVVSQRDPQLLPTIWITLNLLLPIATITAFFYSWMFRSPLVAFVIQLLTLITLFAYAAVTYIVLDIPLWLTLYPLAATLLYLTLTRFPQRFQPEIPTRLYRTNTLAIIAIVIASLTATAFYRVYQVPDVTREIRLTGTKLQINSNALLKSPQPSQSAAFQQQFDDIRRNVTIFPQHFLQDLSNSGLESYHRFLVNNYGFNYAHSKIQWWTIERQPQAEAYKKLLLTTPVNEQILKFDTPIGDVLQLLFYSAKYHESLDNLQTAAEYYIAYNHAIDLMSSPVLSDPFRSNLCIALTSWLNHPSQPIPDRNQLLLRMITRPLDAIDPYTKFRLATDQLIETYAPPFLSSAGLPKQPIEHWTSYFYYLPTERVRLQRLFKLWQEIQLSEFSLYNNYYLVNRDLLVVDNNGQPQTIMDSLLHDGELYEQLRQQTPYIDRDSSPLPKWTPLNLRNLKSSADSYSLNYAYLILTLAHTDLSLNPLPVDDALAHAWRELKLHANLPDDLILHISKQILSHNFSVEQNGRLPVNSQSIGYQQFNDYSSIGQNLLVLIDSTGSFVFKNGTGNSYSLHTSAPYRTLPNLNNPPPIPNYDDLSKLTPEQLLTYFR